MPTQSRAELAIENVKGEFMGIILISVGVFAFVAGMFGKDFYADGQPEQKVATWFGRSIFFLVGALFIAKGVWLLMEVN